MFHKNLLNLMILVFLLCQAHYAMALENIDSPVTQSEINASEENINLAAAKSFVAWYIKNGSEYENFDASWQGWLDDSQVPEKFKIAGKDMKENVKNRLAQWRQQAQDIQQKIGDSTEDLVKDLEKNFQKTKEDTANAIDSWLDQAITGGNEDKTPIN